MAVVEPVNEPLTPVSVMEPLADPNVVELVTEFDPVAVPLVVTVIGLLLPVASMAPYTPLTETAVLSTTKADP